MHLRGLVITATISK